MDNGAARLARAARAWIPLAAVATILCGTVYVVVQQVYRVSANDPQIQLARDAAAALAAGASPQSVVPTGTVDVAASLAPFLVVFDHELRPVAGNGLQGGTWATPPLGVLENARAAGENRVTWQPGSGVRSATVSVYTVENGGWYVFSGRSLKEAERRVDALGWLALVGWAVALAAGFAASWVTASRGE